MSKKVYSVLFYANATVRFEETIEAEHEGDARMAIWQRIRNQQLTEDDFEIAEVPKPVHDIKIEDIEVELESEATERLQKAIKEFDDE